jgi:uncharacterized protein (AIM24 family)
MAEFTVIEEEGLRFVRIRLDDDSARIEAGALAVMRGSITMEAAIPSVGTMVSASLSEERAVRPLLHGTGDVLLESSVGGFHVLEMRDEEWIIERGGYWASDNEISIGVYRERMLNSFWSGDGFIDFCTRAKGSGTLVLTARGPTREVTLGDGERYAAEGRGVVIARTADIHYRVRRPARGIIGSWLSGEGALKVFTGPGRLIIAPRPYWGAFLLEKLGAHAEALNAHRAPAPPPEHERAA